MTYSNWPSAGLLFFPWNVSKYWDNDSFYVIKLQYSIVSQSSRDGNNNKLAENNLTPSFPPKNQLKTKSRDKKWQILQSKDKKQMQMQKAMAINKFSPEI